MAFGWRFWDRRQPPHGIDFYDKWILFRLMLEMLQVFMRGSGMHFTIARYVGMYVSDHMHSIFLTRFSILHRNTRRNFLSAYPELEARGLEDFKKKYD